MADVFISYRRQDSAELAFLIKERLERQKISVFLDLEGLDSSGPFPAKLSNEIADARVFVCLLGPNTLKSNWVQSEVEQAHKLDRKLIPVIQPGFNTLDEPLTGSFKELLECNGVTIPTEKDFLDTALDRVTARVKDALQQPPHRQWLYLVLGLLIGAVLGFLTYGLLDSEPDEPPPPRLTWKVNIADGDRVAQSTTLIVEASREIEGDLWAFVVPPNGRYYPQSNDSCRGLKTPTTGRHWETRIGVGNEDNAGESNDIVLAVAKTPFNSEFIQTKLIAWCRDNNYPGFELLPDDVTEVYRIRDVVRTDERWGSAPVISNARRDGQVSVTSHANGDTVGDEITLTGSYQNTGDDIWVLVHTTYGRWYPQSKTACDGIHTLKDNGNWEASVKFGSDPGAPFDIVVVVADPDASAYFGAWQRVWCRSGFYRGLLTIDLPEGIEEKARLRVYRQ